MTPRVGVNLLWLVPGVVGGSEESTVRALAAVADRVDADLDDLEVVLFALPGLVEAHPALTNRFETLVAPVDGSSKPRRVLAEATWLAVAARRAGVDLVHHAGGVVPLGARRPVTVTIHDVQPLDLPGNFSPTKRAYLRAMTGRSARRAEVVAVPSQFTAERVQDLVGLAPERIAVVPWSAPPPAAPATSDSRELLGDLAGGGPLFLYPAISYPHKHHAAVLLAFEAVRQRMPDARLVFCGRPGPLDDRVRELIVSEHLLGSVHLVGRVETEVLDALYQAATAVVFPSRYEGFGLPVLEAMARGCPVIAADIPAIAEVGAGAADLVDPVDLAAWADAMVRVAVDPVERERLVVAGSRRAAEFSPARTAEALTGVWRRALART